MRRSLKRTLIVAALLCTGFMLYVCATETLFSPSWSDSSWFIAQLRCKSLSQAIDAYANDPRNPNRNFPSTLRELHQPPWGGNSFLQHGEPDLLDPWGKPFEMERRTLDDGTAFALVHTTAPDGRPISQYGIGSASRVK